ncbi:MAG: hypothetical protein WC722_15795, partial [Rhodospirillales bacterium]
GRPLKRPLATLTWHVFFYENAAQRHSKPRGSQDPAAGAARGQAKRGKKEPTVWLPSLNSLAQLLNDENMTLMD